MLLSVTLQKREDQIKLLKSYVYLEQHMMNKDSGQKILYLCRYWPYEKTLEGNYYNTPATINKTTGIIRCLKLLGYEVDVLCTNIKVKLPNSRNSFYDDKLKINIYVANKNNIVGIVRYLLLVIKLSILSIKLYHRNRYKNVIFYNLMPETVIPVILLKIFYRFNLVHEFEERISLDTEAPYLFRLFERIVQFFPFYDRAILVCSNLKEHIFKKDCVIIRGILNDEDISRANEYVPRRETKEENDKIVIMYASTLDSTRGTKNLEEFISKFVKERSNVEIWITGFGKEAVYNYFNNRLSDYNNQVKFFGFLPTSDFKKKLYQADILLNLQDPTHPFSKYCFPSKLIEFMGTGNIVVSTRIGDIEKFHENKIVLIDNDDLVGNLVNSINKIINSFPEYRLYGINARNWAINNCSVNKVSESMKKILA